MVSMDSESIVDYFAVLCSCSIILLLRIPIVSTASDTITTERSLRVGAGERLVSAGGSYELGFFSPGRNSSSRYLGIWYKNIPNQTVVWVANREAPVTGISGVLRLTPQGTLDLLDDAADGGNVVWSSNSSTPETGAQSNLSAQLLESGNLVVRDGRRNYRWQRFDYSCDTLLPGMKMGKNLVTGREWHFSSWKSCDDPSPGDYTYRFDTRGFPQKVLLKGPVEQFRSGPWNGLRFSGEPHLKQNSIYKFKFVLNEEQVCYSYEVRNQSVITRLVLSPDGILKRFTWVERKQAWVLYLTAQIDNCDKYASCGAYGSCDISDSPVCGCLKGFVPKFSEEWGRGDWTNGCVRRTALSCGGDDGFVKYSGIKLPDTKESWFGREMNLEDCRVKCLKDCNCMAYSSLDISTEGGSGCLLWFGDLLDIRTFTENGQEIYVRMASAEIARISIGSHQKKQVEIAVGSILGMLLLGLILSVFYSRKKKLWIKGTLTGTIEIPQEAIEVPFFSYATISNATNQFSKDNRIGEGGFGPVYMGKLENEQYIAVKILSGESRQGLVEFKNEVLLIAKLQHRNLVRLLGCCIQKQIMLIYEYMPNKSLDYYIFDEGSTLLDWPKRLHIINGISRGLVYLHEDSRLRIIHRDIKASNILLDNEMNPKISDFGLARSFGENTTKENTKRVVGTHGYMSPEYAIDGDFSIKSDVFSFGVLLLEMVSGKRNRGFSHPDHDLNLLGHAWRLFKEDRCSELIDLSVWCSCNDPFKVLRYVHVGLLCVQEFPEDRPSMPCAVLMLGSEGSLPEPKQPGFYMKRKPLDADSSSKEHQSWSANEISLTLMDAR